MHIPVVVIGAGHAGLAVSRELTEQSIDHVVLERGEVANTWRTERWDALRLLTPNWQTRLPGLVYDGDDPDGFMTMSEVIDFIDRYATLIDAPVETGTTVQSLRKPGAGYEVVTDRGTWTSDAVVIATGAFNKPKLPALAGDLPAEITSIAPDKYRGPDDLSEGGVLVVGASATGSQIADELLRSGRDVTLCVGEHVRMPRVYRGKDVQWWFDRTGLADESYQDVDDIVRARHVPSPQLIGTANRRDLDLNALVADGARLVGRLSAVNGSRVHFAGSLPNVCKLADLKLGRLLDTFDEWAATSDETLESPHRYRPTEVDDRAALQLDLETDGIKTVFWATGFRPDYSWLDIPILDRKGEMIHDGGVVTQSPGLYRIGLPFLRRRKSTFIHGAGDDARDLVDHLAAHLARRTTARTA